MHKSLVCKSSEFFQASVSVQWKEGQYNIVRLPDCTPQTFSTYIGWLYTNEVDFLEQDEKKLAWIEKDGTPLTQKLRLTKRAIDCYQLGDMLLDSGFHNAVLDQLINICQKCNTIPSHESINHAWKTIPHRSKLVNLIVDLYATKVTIKEFDMELPRLPVVFVSMVAMAGVRDRQCDGRKLASKAKCHYHKHGSLNESCTSERCMCAECRKVEEDLYD